MKNIHLPFPVNVKFLPHLPHKIVINIQQRAWSSKQEITVEMPGNGPDTDQDQ